MPKPDDWQACTTRNSAVGTAPRAFQGTARARIGDLLTGPSTSRQGQPFQRQPRAGRPASDSIRESQTSGAHGHHCRRIQDPPGASEHGNPSPPRDGKGCGNRQEGCRPTSQAVVTPGDGGCCKTATSWSKARQEIRVKLRNTANDRRRNRPPGRNPLSDNTSIFSRIEQIRSIGGARPE